MLTDAGKTLGFRGGKAQRSWELIQALNARESTLNALYDFRPLISPEGWLPPVIDEAQDVAHITPDQIRPLPGSGPSFALNALSAIHRAGVTGFSGAFNNSHSGYRRQRRSRRQRATKSVGNRITAGMAGRKTKRRPDA